MTHNLTPLTSVEVWHTWTSFFNSLIVLGAFVWSGVLHLRVTRLRRMLRRQVMRLHLDAALRTRERPPDG